MTAPLPALHRPALTLEQQAAAIGHRYSRTSAERETIATDAHRLLTTYEMQGGRYALKWLESHAGLSHSTAVNLRDAGLALSRGAQAGQGVSQLAIVGRWLRKGKTLSEAQQIATDSAARKAAADAAGIGVASVKYPSTSAEDMASAYADTAQTIIDEGLTVPDVPELTATLVQIGAAHATPAVLREVLTGSGQPEKAKSDIPAPALDYYGWLARQPCAVCGVPGVELHHLRQPDLPGHAGGRRFKDDARELLLPLCPRHHQHAADAAHQTRQADWSRATFGREDGATITAAQYLTAYLLESGLLRRGQP